MIAIITNISTTLFSFNGIQYQKNFQSKVSGTKIQIVGIYDSRFELLPLSDYTEISLNGSVRANVGALQAALLPVIFTRSSLTGTVINGEVSEIDLAALDQSDEIAAHLADLDNPHQVDKNDVGLGNADNTSDEDKPISIAQALALNAKADSAGLIILLSSAGNKTGRWVLGKHPNINGNRTFLGLSNNAQPTSEAHIDEFLITL